MSDNTKVMGDQAFLRRERKGTHAENTFSGALSFLRRQYSREVNSGDIVVLGVPFDMATSYRSGARFGPSAVRAASVQLAELKAYPYGFDPFDKLSVIDYGDVDYNYGYPDSIVEKVEQSVGDILSKGGKTLCIGGDHFITYPILKAYHKHHGKAFSLLHFDAHPDTWPDDGKRLDHGSMFLRAKNEKLVTPEQSVQVGIRTWVSDKQGFNHIGAPDIHSSTPENIAQNIYDIIGDSPTYLTFDIDCLDPAFAPGTGTPVAGGLSTAQALAIIRQLDKLNFIGMDIVEVAPAYDHSDITAIAAATIAYEWLCLLAQQQNNT